MGVATVNIINKGILFFSVQGPLVPGFSSYRLHPFRKFKVKLNSTPVYCVGLVYIVLV